MINPFKRLRGQIKKPQCIILEKEGIELKVCEHFSMWQLITPYTHSTGLLHEGQAAGFSGAMAWAVRESAQAQDADSITTLNELIRCMGYEDLRDDNPNSLLEPVYDITEMTTKY